MFKKIATTSFPPNQPTLIYDGQCGFCKYWLSRWKMHAKDNISARPYQEIHEQYGDIPEKEFKKASRLIEPNGNVFNGPDSAFRSYYLSDRKKYLHHWYTQSKFFRWITNQLYHFIATHRPLMFTLSTFFFGTTPTRIWLKLALWFLLFIFLIATVGFIL